MSEIRGLTIPIGADTKKFNREIKDMDKDIANTSKRIDILSKSLDIKWDSEKFAQAQREAQKAIEQTDTKAIKLREQLKMLEDTKSTDNKGMDKLRTDIEKVELQAVQLRQKLDEIRNLRFEHIGEQFEKVGGSISNLGKAMAPVSAAATALLGSFTAIATSAVKFGDKIGTTAQQLNISSEALQKWNYIASQADVGESEMINGITKIQTALGELATGNTSKATNALSRLGISTSKAAEGMGANFENIILSLSNVESSIEQAALANELFGAKLGSKLIPMLNDGGEGLSTLSAEFEALGYLTNAQIDDLDAFEDAVDKLKYQLGLLKNQIGVALLPLMKELGTFVQERIIPAFQKLTDWFTSLSTEQQKTIFSTLAIIAALAPALMIVGKVTTAVGGLVKQLGMIGQAFSFLAAHPIILVIAAVIGMMIYLYKSNEEFKNSVDGLVSTIGSSLQPILETLVSLFQNIIKSLMPIIKAIADLLVPIFNTVIRIISKIVDVITPLINVYLAALSKQFEVIAKVITVLAKIVTAVLVPVFEFVGKVVGDIFDEIAYHIESVINFIVKFVNGLIDVLNVIGSIVGLTIDKLNQLDGSAIETVNTVVNKDETNPLSPQTAIETSGSTTQSAPIYNNDYSNKDIVINVTVENFAKEVDVDNLVRQINLKMAEAY